MASCRAKLIGLSLLCAAPLSLHAADLVVTSQNALHYGWGDTNPNRSPFNQYKVDKIWENLSQGGIGLLQEVMPKADMGKFSKCTGTCKVFRSANYGHGWYKESYVFFVIDPATLKPPADVTECKATKAACGFSRPPASLLLTPASGAGGIWVVNFHAIWGKNKGGRIEEAKGIAKLQAALTAGVAKSSVIVGGDWNLSVEEVSAAVSCKPVCAAPSEETTLKTDGSGLSSSYDHFIGTTVPKSPSVLKPTVTYKVWRDKVSDHLGVKATFTY